MDWILISEVISSALNWLGVVLLYTFIFSFAYAAIFELYTQTYNDEKMSVWVKSYIKKYILLAIIGIILCVLSDLSSILVKTNITKIKIRYTDMKTVEKLEAGALKVVDKLDNLIDKGIKSIGKEEKGE